jgi:hypothetical protein
VFSLVILDAGRGLAGDDPLIEEDRNLLAVEKGEETKIAEAGGRGENETSESERE